jgi:riboflavin kinase / FMN adenylyltransferase
MYVFQSPVQLRQAFAQCVATIGKYDGMHLGHQRILDGLLSEAATCSLPAVVILSEPQPEEFFAGSEAPARLNHFQDKVRFLAQYGIDAVYMLQFDERLSQQEAEAFVRGFLVAGLGVRSVVVGDDFRFGCRRTGDIALLQLLGPELGFRVQAIGACCESGERVSSTLIRQYLQQGDCARAAALLGRPYSISGTVVQGRQLGRQIGVPTANMELQSPILPLGGVFAVKVSLPSGQVLAGVANVGYKPTVDETRIPSLEVHLFDFSGDLYGSVLQVEFLSKLRDEQKFAGLPQLLEQIHRDIALARLRLGLASLVESA